MLVDQATIIVRSGKGGDGVVSFRRAKYVPKGGPDGGDGGDGGSVYLVATPGVDTLLDFAGRHHWLAAEGQPGAGKQCHGANGSDLEVKVPPGTLVYDDETGELIADLDQDALKIKIVQGGRGGFGNEHFKSATNQTPRQHTDGEPYQERSLRLELKLIADIGLVGLPNAGKSTLLSCISKARPKIGDYPFTTLEPNLGIASLSGYRRMVVADIPGLIEGAHDGHGLGTQFLRHIERTRLLVHLLEADPPSGPNVDPVENYRVIRNELAGYSHVLADKPQIIALSKIDLLASPEDQQTAIDMIQDAIGCPVVPISAATGQGLDRLLEACWLALQQEKGASQESNWPKTPHTQEETVPSN